MMKNKTKTSFDLNDNVYVIFFEKNSNLFK